jgi:hypothetical protein
MVWLGGPLHRLAPYDLAQRQSNPSRLSGQGASRLLVPLQHWVTHVWKKQAPGPASRRIVLLAR